MKLIWLFILYSITGQVYGQDSSAFEWRLGYSGGNIVHPGLSLSACKPFSYSLKSKSKNRSILNQVIYGAEVGFYYHQNYQTGLWGQVMLGMRRTRFHTPRKKYRSINLGMGLITTLVPNSYEVTENEIRHRAVRQYSHLLLSPSVEWGGELNSKAFTGWYIRPKIQWHIPYFQGSNQYLLLEFGLKL